MAVELIIAPEAADDVASAYAWYESRRPGLGEDFLGALDATLEGIRRQPEMHTAVYKSYRRALVRRFPYGVFYESSEATAIVYGVFHSSRDPQKWRERLPI